MNERATKNISQFRDQLVRCISIVSGLGIDIGRGRIRGYLEILEAVIAGKAVNMHLLHQAACEIAELEEALSLPSDLLFSVRGRLHLLCDGPWAYTKDGGSDPGRDLLFELVTASLFLPTHNTTVQDPTDVVVDFSGHPMFIECKRPTTDDAFGNRLKVGFKQLSELRREGSIGYGSVAFDLSAIINPEAGMLVLSKGQDAMATMLGHFQNEFRRASDEIRRALRNARKDAEVDFLLFRLRCMVELEGSPPCIRQLWHVEPLRSIDDERFKSIYAEFSRVAGFIPGVTAYSAGDPRLPTSR